MYLSDDVKKELVDKITKVTKVKKIILFGSYSKGTATDESDIDLLIIENEINSKTLRIDGTTRKNSKASIGQEVTVQKAEAKEA